MNGTIIPFHLRYFDWHPGEMIKDEMESLGYTQKELADRLGLSPKVVCDLIKHKTRITPEYALLLSRVLDRSSEYWLTLEQNWSESQKRKAENEELNEYRDWIKRFHAKYLEDNGIIPKHSIIADRIRELLRLFRIAYPKCIDAVISEFNASYRKRETKHGTIEGRFVWLSVGRRIVETLCVSYPDYDVRAFKAALKHLRNHLRDEIDKSKLQKLFFDSGVALIFVPKIKNNVVYGATYWHCGRPVIQMVCEYASDDQFWFNLIHETWHVLEGNKNLTSINIGECEIDDSESKADIHASEFLIPAKQFAPFVKRFQNGIRPKEIDIKEFARDLNVPDSVVLGRLQHLKILPYFADRNLKKPMSFESDTVCIDIT